MLNKGSCIHFCTRDISANFESLIFDGGTEYGLILNIIVLKFEQWTHILSFTISKLVWISKE